MRERVEVRHERDRQHHAREVVDDEVEDVAVHARQRVHHLRLPGDRAVDAVDDHRRDQVHDRRARVAPDHGLEAGGAEQHAAGGERVDGPGEPDVALGRARLARWVRRRPRGPRLVGRRAHFVTSPPATVTRRDRRAARSDPADGRVARRRGAADRPAPAARHARLRRLPDRRRGGRAIRDLTVRGAPALGATGAFGVALAARGATGDDVPAAAAALRSARPTAVNLAWGVDEALAAWRTGGAAAALARAEAIAADDVAGEPRAGRARCRRAAAGASVLTHCNAGALACVGYGTAIGVIRAAHESGRRVSVWVDETRPVLQGARLTAWELDRLGIPYRVVVDAAAGSLFARGRGRRGRRRRRPRRGQRRRRQQDRHLPAGGARAMRTACRSTSPRPTTTIDPATADRRRHPDRAPRRGRGDRRRRDARRARRRRGDNPAFDVTPARLVTALITERGVLHRPDAAAIAAHLA